MTSTSFLSDTADVTLKDYCVFGLATCFLKEDGEFYQVEVIEPIPSAALEAILKGIPTSYKIATAKTVGDVVSDNGVKVPDEFPANINIQVCDNFEERLIASVRTYKNRPEATQHIPINTTYQDFNYSLEKKRVLNATNVVKAEDNVKQHPNTHKIL
ncbi:MAG: hypothetical protein AB4041_03305 [Microcystaceae cyanobacterium]